VNTSGQQGSVELQARSGLAGPVPPPRL